MAEMRCDFGSHSWFGVLHSDSKRVSDTSMHFHRLPLKHLLTYKVLLFPHQQSALSTACDANYHDELRPETLQFQLSSSATQLFIPTSQSRSAVTQIIFSQQIEVFQVSTMTSRTAGIPKAEYRRKKKNRHKANKRAANKMLSLFADMTLASTISIGSIEGEHEFTNKGKPTTKTKRSKAGVEKRRTRSSKSRMAKAADPLGKLALNIDNLENNKDDRDIEHGQKSST